MKRHSFLVLAALAASVATAGCGADAASTDDIVPTRITLSQGSSALLASAASGLVADLVAGGRLDLALVDSLFVTVTRVDVLPDSLIRLCHPPVGDSTRGFRPGRPAGMGQPGGMMGPGGLPCGMRRPGGPGRPGVDSGFPPPPMRPDSLRPDSGFGRPMNHWYSLDVVGNGRVDLLRLPTDASSGITLAAGDLPAGDYGAARLIVTDATIWFNTAITTDSGFTLQPNTAYPVVLPRMAERVGLISNAGFTVPDGGGTVSLVFDANATVGGAVVTDRGRVILTPVLRPHRPR